MVTTNQRKNEARSIAATPWQMQPESPDYNTLSTLCRYSFTQIKEHYTEIGKRLTGMYMSIAFHFVLVYVCLGMRECASNGRVALLSAQPLNVSLPCVCVCVQTCMAFHDFLIIHKCGRHVRCDTNSEALNFKIVSTFFRVPDNYRSNYSRSQN